MSFTKCLFIFQWTTIIFDLGDLQC